MEAFKAFARFPDAAGLENRINANKAGNVPVETVLVSLH